MKKKICMLCLVLACLLVLAGCGCKHETWNEADCVTPKTCAECGETEGEALGHSWADADCLNPKTCEACGETEGEALGHSWVEATTEAPKTCETCGATEGDRIITDERFTTAEAEPFFGTWQGEILVTEELLSAMGLEGMQGEVPVTATFTFSNAGDVTVAVEFSDWEAFLGVMRSYMKEMLYAEFAAQGMDKATTDSTLKEFYGMTMDELVETSLAAVKPEDVNSKTEMVYYVENGNLYTAMSWDEEMYLETYSWDGEKLIMTVESLGEITLTRIAE